MRNSSCNPNIDSSSSAVICDHLAFSVPLSHFEHLEKAGRAYRKYWQDMPAYTLDDVSDPDTRYNIIQSYHRESHEVLFNRMCQFLSNIMGLQVVPVSRDKGLHGYKDSHRILDMTGKIELGFVGIGGNNNTVYIQVSGEGCKHVFSYVSPLELHFWLSNVLSITRLTRIDLAYDCFQNYFSCDYANLAYADGMFQNANGGPMPEHNPRPSYRGNILIGELISVGSRKSNIYWRIYDKAKEQGINEQSWYRSEVELKRISVDVLLDFNGTFSGLNAFAASFNLGEGVSIRASKKRVRLDLAGRIRWAKRQCGRTLSDLLDVFGGDLQLAFGALCDERGGKFSLPDTQSILINNHIHTHMNVLNHSKLALGVNLAIRNTDPCFKTSPEFIDSVRPVVDEEIFDIRSISTADFDLYNHGAFLDSASRLVNHKYLKKINSERHNVIANVKKQLIN